MSEEEAPKIIVDDDWKSQVAQEKEQLAKEAESTDEAEAMPELPPASFTILVSTLSTQAVAAMGFLPDPATGKPNVNRPMAKHFIDTLAMLQEKTQGNLTEEESAHLRDALHQLRMAYVAIAEKSPSEPAAEKKSSISVVCAKIALASSS